MSNYKIGRVVGVCSDKIEITLLDHIEACEERLGVPHCMSVSIDTPKWPTTVINWSTW